MKRVVILGPGASGKSTLAAQLGEITGLPVIELDKVFWQSGLTATPRDNWIKIQEQLVQGEERIMYGDLGPYDAVEVRLPAANTIIFLDFSRIRCAWRAIRRSRERADFCWWLFGTVIGAVRSSLEAINRFAGRATLRMIRNSAGLRQFVASIRRTCETAESNAED